MTTLIVKKVAFQDQERVGLFTSRIIFGAYDNYAQIGIYVAGVALFAGLLYMIWQKKLQKLLLGLLLLNFIAALWLAISF